MFPHTVPSFKTLEAFVTIYISILQMVCLNMPPHVSFPLHNPTGHTPPQATTLVHHLGISQHVQEVAWQQTWILTTIYENYLIKAFIVNSWKMLHRQN